MKQAPTESLVFVVSPRVDSCESGGLWEIVADARLYPGHNVTAQLKRRDLAELLAVGQSAWAERYVRSSPECRGRRVVERTSHQYDLVRHAD